ncbi:MAG: DUF1134 domain-containing protein [Halothiobacillaceae bacterium]|nr:DUF1134 domain-containing protein [Halothiobacillaceae bacterium]
MNLSLPTKTLIAFLFTLGAGGCATAPATDSTQAQTAPATNLPVTEQATHDTYDKDASARAAADFLGTSAEKVAELIDRAFKDHGRPNAFIRGEEGGGALAVGVRYGHGELITKSGESRRIYWQGPSLGLDAGANAGKVFMLIYNLQDPDLIYQRFPGVAGSAYFVGGMGMSYNSTQKITIAPIRVGVGIRLGANVGYMHFTRDPSWIPF